MYERDILWGVNLSDRKRFSEKYGYHEDKKLY